jgi:hypothetical protein
LRIGSFACSSRVGARPSQNCVTLNIALRIVGVLRWPCWSRMPFEVASCSVNPRSGLWHVAHAVECRQRGACRRTASCRGPPSQESARYRPGPRPQRGRGAVPAGRAIWARLEGRFWRVSERADGKVTASRAARVKVVNIGAMRLGPSARRGKTPPPVNAATARQPLTLSAAQMDDVVPSAVASAMGLADGLGNLEPRRQPSYSAPRTQSRAVPLPSAFRQHRCWRRRQRSPILGGRASTVVFRHRRHAKSGNGHTEARSGARAPGAPRWQYRPDVKLPKRRDPL